MIMTFSIGANATDKEPYMSVSGAKEATETQMELAANLSKDGLAVNRTVEEALATVQGARSTNWIYTPTGIFTIMVKSRITLVGLLL